MKVVYQTCCGDKPRIEGTDYSVNEQGIPFCPNAPSPLMRREVSKTHLRCGLPTMKFAIFQESNCIFF